MSNADKLELAQLNHLIEKEDPKLYQFSIDIIENFQAYYLILTDEPNTPLVKLDTFVPNVHLP
jgi:hypothetical protein